MLLRAVALSVAFVSVARADGAQADDTRAWEARLGAGVGAARMAMLGGTHAGVGITIDLDVLHALTSTTAAGLYVGELVAEPWTPVKDDAGKTTFRDLAFEIEPELAHRVLHPLGAHAGVGWEVTGSAGVVVARTYESCSSYSRHHGCALELEHSTELGVTTGVNAFAYAGPVLVDIGARAQTDTAGDAAIALQASAGAIF